MEDLIYKSHDLITVDCVNDEEKQEILYVEKIMKEWGKDIAVIVLSPKITVGVYGMRKKKIQTRATTTYTFHKSEEIKK